jgi:hypothetical protein
VVNVLGIVANWFPSRVFSLPSIAPSQFLLSFNDVIQRFARIITHGFKFRDQAVLLKRPGEKIEMLK